MSSQRLVVNLNYYVLGSREPKLILSRPSRLVGNLNYYVLGEPTCYVATTSRWQPKYYVLGEPKHYVVTTFC